MTRPDLEFFAVFPCLQVMSRAFSGAKRVLGCPDAGWQEVIVVAHTQNWAKAGGHVGVTKFDPHVLVRPP